jgi:predicted dehydrogenase
LKEQDERMAPLRVGLLGTGYWALHVHGTALTTSPQTSLDGIWGRDPAKANDLAARLRTKGYDDLDELLGSVDAVSIALPPDIQAKLAVRAARAGCHLLMDKPLALDVNSAQAVVDAVDQAGVAAIVFFTQRFRPDMEDWTRASAEAGPWHSAHLVHYANIYGPGSPYATSAWRKQYGALWDVGPHALAAVLPIMGKVTSVAARRGPKGSDTVQVVLNHEPLSATSTVSMSLTMPAAATSSQLVLYGEHGTRARPEGNSDAVGTFGIAIRELADLIESGERAHRCDAHFGLEVVQVLAAAGQALDLPPIELPHE